MASIKPVASYTGGEFTVIQSGDYLDPNVMPSLAGDVTSSAGGTVTTISVGAVTLAKMADMATASLIGRNTGGTGVPEVLSVATARTMLSINNVENTALSTWVGSTAITTLGTIGTGTWNATTIAVNRGGTGLTTYTTNNLLYATGATTLAGLSTANNGVLVTSGAGVPSISSTLPTGLSVPGMVVSTNAAVSAAGTTQGTGTAITSDRSVVTTVAAASGVVLPTAVAGRTVVIVNKGANALRVYPAVGGAVDALGTNNPVTVAVDGWLEFNATSATQWYSSANGVVNASAISGTLAVSQGGTGATATTGSGSNVLGTSPTLTTPVIDAISASGVAATPTLWGNVTTGSITIGGGVTTGTINIATGSDTAKIVNVGTGSTTTTLNGNVRLNAIVSNNLLYTTTNGQITAATSANVASVIGSTFIANATNATTSTNIAGGTTGALAVQTGVGTTGFVSAVAAGSILVSNGTGAAPVYSATPSITTSLTVPTLQGTTGAGGAITIRGGTDSAGTVNLNAATVNSNAATLTLFGTPTTVTALGAATTVSVGAATGNTTVNHNLVVSGNLTVNGSTITMNTAEMTVDDKNIELGSVVAVNGVTATSANGSATVTGMSTTAGLIPGMIVTVAGGSLTLVGGTQIATIVSSTSVTLTNTFGGSGSSTTLNFAGASDTTANGGGITLKGATDKTLIWDSANTNWTSSEHWNIATGKVFKINNAQVLSATALGTSVVGSSLTSVGTLTNLTVAGQITSQVTTGTAPFVVSSTTQVANLNAATAGLATHHAGGAAGQISYQSAANTTAFLAAGTTSQVLIGGASAPAWSNTPTLTGTNFTAIPNAALTNSAVTVGSTSISLGATATTLAGLTSVTSTTFVGSLTGSASQLNGQAASFYVDLANATGNLAVARLNSGTGASASTYWRGDGTWAAMAGEGFSWVTITGANVSPAVTNTGYIMETGGVQRTITLPANAAAGFNIAVNASAGNVLIVSNGNIIDGVGAGNDLLLSDGNTATLVAKATGSLEILYGGTSAAPAGGGGGTVTSVSVTTANGVSGSVLTETTTPAITITLGAITPSSVASTGTVTGTNLSGTNTGDQTITLTGNVTGSGTGSFATTIAAGAVSLANMANLAQGAFIARNSSGTGTPEAVPVATVRGMLSIGAPRTQTLASSNNITPNADSDDMVVITAQTANPTFVNPTGTPAEGQKLVIRMKDNGSIKTISFGNAYRGIGLTLPTATVASKWLYMGFIYNATDSLWDLIATAQE
jgi:hypothetical protein